MRTALVTGGSRGIGLAITRRLKAQGCVVIAPSRAEMDLFSNEAIDAYVASLAVPVDILVNDAGINRVAEFDAINDGDLAETLQVNLIAPLRLIRAIAPGMQDRRYGRIVNVSSIWSIVSRIGRTSYSMSKAAINSMTRSLAVELAPYNVLANTVAPGYVLTELTRHNNTDGELVKIADSIPAKRLAEPEEIAALIGFLCSDDNTYLTGQTIVIDGGYTCL